MKATISWKLFSSDMSACYAACPDALRYYSGVSSAHPCSCVKRSVSCRAYCSNTNVSDLHRVVSTVLGGLKECIRFKDLTRGRQIHAHVADAGLLSNIYVANTLINMYSKCRSMTDAQNVFDSLVQRDVVSWNSLLQGYVDNGDAQMTLRIFDSMEKAQGGGFVPDARTYVSALSACATLAASEQKTGRFEEASTTSQWLEKGRALHSQAVVNRCCNAFVETMLINMYTTCGSMVHARSVFDGMVQRDVVAWNALLQGYVENGQSELALELFDGMERARGGCAPNARTYVAALMACATLGGKQRCGVLGKAVKWLAKGKAIHSQAVTHRHCTIFVESTLVDMYAKCGSMADARSVFDNMTHCDVVCWNCLIQGYVDNGENELALDLIAGIERSGLQPNSTTFVVALMACANLMALETGRKVHADVWKHNLEKQLATCLVDFYGKCGSMEDAKQVFDSITVKDLWAWNSLLYGYSQQGDTANAMELFEKMEKQRVAPDRVTFTHILTACSYAGLRVRGREYFDVMQREYGISPDLIHYTCLVDMCARANDFDEALRIVRSMPFEADAVTWTAVLGASWKWKNVEVAKIAYESLMKLEDDKSILSAHALMANIIGSARKDNGFRGDNIVSRKASKSWWTDTYACIHKFTS